jgi:5'-nucleotidase
MRILITNDDGILAPGLAVAEEIAAEIAGPDGEVWVIAPESERSGVSHCISYTRPMRMEQVGERRFAVEGNPADCIIVGVHHVLRDALPDLVISGVNAGHNVAEDTAYSGTVGGAMEGALQGLKAVALSQFYSVAAHAPDDRFAPARAFGVDAVRRALEAPWGQDVFYNINFPAHKPELAKGFAVCHQGRREAGAFACVEAQAPNRRRYFWLAHQVANATASPGSDAALCLEGHVTVTPMRPDLTDRDLFDGARAAFEG